MDSAHNPEGISCLVNQFKKEKNNYKVSSLLFGAMRDKNIDEMLLLVKDIFNNIYFYEINYERAASIGLLTERAEKRGIKFSVVKNLDEFIKQQLHGDKENCLVIAGSMYLLGEIKSFLPEIKS